MVKKKSQICKVCGKKFQKKDPRSVTCGSSYCRHRNWKVSLYCAVCGDRFFPTYGREREQKYCSMKCHGRSRQKKKQFTCGACGSVFWSVPWKNPKFCSTKCSGKARRTGRFSRKISSKSGLDSMWSFIVREKAQGRCEICGVVGKVMNAHHIISRKCASTRWYIPNGICLCVSCHRFGKEAVHENSLYFMPKLIKVRGQAALDHLKVKGKEVFKWKQHIEEIREYLYKEKEKLL